MTTIHTLGELRSSGYKIRSVKDEGAFYYFEKPIDMRRLQLVLRKAAEYSSARHAN